MPKSDRTQILYARISPENKKSIQKLRPKNLSEAEFVDLILTDYFLSRGVAPRIAAKGSRARISKRV